MTFYSDELSYKENLILALRAEGNASLPLFIYFLDHL